MTFNIKIKPLKDVYLRCATHQLTPTQFSHLIVTMASENMTTIIDDSSTNPTMWTTLVTGDMENIEPTKWKISPYAYHYTVNYIYVTIMIIMASKYSVSYTY